MRDRRSFHAILVVAVAVAAMCGMQAAARDARTGPGLGTSLDPKDIVPIDLTVDPDGTGLPAGSGDGVRGKAVYAEQCAACHGEAGAGGVGGIPRLTGGIGSLATAKPMKTVNSFWPYAPLVFDYTRRAMPISAPQSLSADDTYAVIAYLLSVDGIVSPKVRIDARALAKVRMPNRDGFRPQWSAEGKPLAP